MLYQKIKNNIPKLIRFGLVGTLGAIINFMVYYIAVKFAHFGVNLSAICAFSIAVTNNYILNHYFTFGRENENNSINIQQFIYYLLGNMGGLLINLIVLNMVILFAGGNFHFVGQALGIICGMLSNFIFAKKFVFSIEMQAILNRRIRLLQIRIIRMIQNRLIPFLYWDIQIFNHKIKIYNFLFWIISLVFFVIAFATIGQYLYYIGLIISFPYDWEPTDGDHLNFAHRLAQGLPIYLSITDGYVLSIYNPLYHGIIALLGGSHASLSFARSIALLFWLLIPLTVLLFNKNKWGYLYVILAAIFLLLPPEPWLLIDIVQVSPNSTMAFLFTLSLLYAAKCSEDKDAPWWNWILLGFIAALCFLAKQQGLIAVAIVVVFLLIRRIDIRKISIALLGFFFIFIFSAAYLEITNSGQYLRATFFDLNKIMITYRSIARSRLIDFFKHNFAFIIVVLFSLFTTRFQFNRISIWHISLILHIPFLFAILGNGGGGPNYFLTFWITIVMLSVEIIKKYKEKLFAPDTIKENKPSLITIFPIFLLFALFINISIGAVEIHRQLNTMPSPTKIESLMKDYYQSIGSLIATKPNARVLTNRNIGALISNNVNVENEGSTMFQYAWPHPKTFNRNLVLESIKEKKYDFIITGIQEYPDDIKQEIKINYKIALIKDENLIFGNIGPATVYIPK